MEENLEQIKKDGEEFYKCFQPGELESVEDFNQKFIKHIDTIVKHLRRRKTMNILINTNELTNILNAVTGIGITAEEIVASIEKSYPAPKDSAICIGAKKLEKILEESYSSEEVMESLANKTLDAWVRKHQNKELTFAQEKTSEPVLFAEISDAEQETDEQLFEEEKELSETVTVDLEKLDKKLGKIFEEDEYEVNSEGVTFHGTGNDDLHISMEKLEKKLNKFAENEKPYKSLTKWLEKKYDEHGFEEELDEEYEDELDGYDEEDDFVDDYEEDEPEEEEEDYEME